MLALSAIERELGLLNSLLPRITHDTLVLETKSDLNSELGRVFNSLVSKCNSLVSKCNCLLPSGTCLFPSVTRLFPSVTRLFLSVTRLSPSVTRLSSSVYGVVPVDKIMTATVADLLIIV